MKVVASITALSLVGSVSATLGIISSSKCWRRCARQVGVECGWGDVTCNCRAVNAGYYAAANQCYCNMCSDDTSRVAVDWTSMQLNTFSLTCSVALEPLSQRAIDKAVAAASCDTNGNGHISPSNQMPAVMPVSSPPNVDEVAAPPSQEDYQPPPPPSRPKKENLSSSLPPISTTTLVVDFESSLFEQATPTGGIGVSSIVVPIAATPSREVSYSYATLTVPVTPVPVTTTTAASAAGSKSSTSTTTQIVSSAKANTQQAKGAAPRKEVGAQFKVSVFAFAAIIFGL